MATLVMSPRNGLAGAAIGGLFNGLAFFLVMRLPSRSNYIEKIQANGGRVVKLEAQADHIIADHLRRDCPPGSISYTFIDDALKSGVLPDPNDHLAGRPIGVVRNVGSLTPTKSTRTPFTAEDDRMLWDWVERAKVDGGMVRGNVIYKRFEEANPRHTWQAWRDRYIKRLLHKSPIGVQITVAANPPPSLPEVSEAQVTEARSNRLPDNPRKRKATPPPTPAEEIALQSTRDAADEPMQDDDEEASADERDQYQRDFDSLIANAWDILGVDDALVDTAWNAWASKFSHRTAREWQTLWEEKVLPEHEARRRAAKRRKRSSAGSGNASSEQDKTPKGPKARLMEDTGVSEVDQGVRDDPVPELPASGNRRGETQQLKNAQDEVRTDSRTKSANSAQSYQDSPFTMNTSEANKAVEWQLQQEASALTDESNVDSRPRTSELNTLEANQAADSQLRRESLEIADEDIDEDVDDSLGRDQDNKITISTHPIEDGEVEDGLPGEEIFQPDVSVGEALTEANLASQQAEFTPKSLRGVDLLENDEMGDQSEFPNFLETFLETRNSATQDVVIDLTAESAEEEQEQAPAKELAISHLTNKDDVDFNKYINEDSDLVIKDDAKSLDGTLPPSPGKTLPSRPESPHRKSGPHVPTAVEAPVEPLALPFSSQAELDNAIVGTLQWPLSPKHTKDHHPTKHSQAESQGLRYDVGIDYPRLPDQNASVGKRSSSSDFRGLGVPFQAHIRFNHMDAEEDDIQSQVDVEPGQLQNSRNNVALLNTSSEKPSALKTSTPPTNSKSEKEQAETEGGSTLGDGDNNINNDEDDDDDEDDLDLGVVEPEGGFVVASSPIFAPSVVQVESAEEHPTKSPAGQQHMPQRQIKQEESFGDPNEESSSECSQSSGEEEVDEVDMEKEAAQHPNQPQGTTARPNSRPRTIETQDILNAETQGPDLDIPLPPDSLPSSPPAKELSSAPFHPIASSTSTPTPERPQPPPQSQPLNSASSLETFISKMHLSHNLSEPLVIYALKRTSLRPNLAELVLLEQKAGRGLPADVPGVWTEAEDEVLEGGDAVALEALVRRKGGWAEVEARMEFWRVWRALD